MKLGYVIGRFNPLHKGHEHIIEKMINDNDEHIIFIGSSNKSRTKENPFSFEERKEMILKVFPHANVISLPDFNNLSDWKSNLLTNIDNFIKEKISLKIKEINLYTGIKKGDDVLRNEWLHGTGHNIQGVVLKNNINATDIRNNIYNNNNIINIKELHKEIFDYILNKKEILLEI
tara:strand:+ start:24905 stop:25429 length:525 start_codon:yes stop_codon:yes gene_type:complete